MLRACRSALKPGGRLAFYTIFIPLGPSEEVRRRVARETSFGNYSRSSPDAMLRTVGFTDVHTVDVTDEYLRIARAWYEAWARRADAVRARDGAKKFDDDQATRARSIAAIEAGQLKRALFVARRAPRRARR